MAEPLTFDEARRAIDGTHLGTDAFDLLRYLGRLAASSDITIQGQARELVIRFLERRDELDGMSPILNSLAERLGLMPYLDTEALSLAELVVYEAHRPRGMPGENIVFHSMQMSVYDALLGGENVILSAPTSFGKSLIIDAIVALRQFDNIAVIVPTLALIEETRRRLARFSADYKVITHSSQALSERNLFVLTQERLLDFDGLPRIGFFVVDEFYKLDQRGDAERANLLNQAFYRLWKQGGQFYLLGPSIQSIPQDLPITARFIQTDFSTVALDLRRVDRRGGDEEALVDLCRSLDQPTLIYCRSPKRVRDVVTWLMNAGVNGSPSGLESATDWMGTAYHSAWRVVAGLKTGIGSHHGRLPRSIGHFMVRAFNEGRFQFLVCTSTLIEGVNTTAKNVVILDPTVAQQRYDFFTFNNIRGRSGRMFHHFVGHVYLFHDPPQPGLPQVDMPILTQPDNAESSLLLQIEDGDLSDRSRERLRPFEAQEDLPIEVLRANNGVDPDRQIAVARQIRGDLARYQGLLGWSGYPRYEQLEAVCELIFMLMDRPRRGGVFSSRQLAFRINQLRMTPDIKELIEGSSADDPDDAVEDVLEFLRQWPGHSFPRLLSAVDKIQSAIFHQSGLRPGNFSFYGALAENLFELPPLASLEEFGVPIQAGQILVPRLPTSATLDDLLSLLASLDVDSLPIHPFLKELLRDAKGEASEDSGSS